MPNSESWNLRIRNPEFVLPGLRFAELVPVHDIVEEFTARAIFKNHVDFSLRLQNLQK
jgi:hypothetical protein